MKLTKKRPRRPNHAKLYKALNLPKSWVAVLNGYPNPLEVLPIMMTARSIAVAEETCEAIEDLADALMEDEPFETGEIVTVQ